MSSQHATCLVCNQTVNLESDELSPYAKALRIHHYPCFFIYGRIRRITHHNASIGDVVDDFVEYASMLTLGRHDLYDSYLVWWISLLLATLRNKETLTFLDKVYDQATEKFAKEKESENSAVQLSGAGTGEESE